MPQGRLLQVPEGSLPGTSFFLLLVRERSGSPSEPLPPPSICRAEQPLPSCSLKHHQRKDGGIYRKGLWMEVQQEATPRRVTPTLPLRGESDSRQVLYASPEGSGGVCPTTHWIPSGQAPQAVHMGGGLRPMDCVFCFEFTTV